MHARLLAGMLLRCRCCCGARSHERDAQAGCGRKARSARRTGPASANTPLSPACACCSGSTACWAACPFASACTRWWWYWATRGDAPGAPPCTTCNGSRPPAAALGHANRVARRPAPLPGLCRRHPRQDAGRERRHHSCQFASEGEQGLLALAAQGRGAVIVTGHIGCMELCRISAETAPRRAAQRAGPHAACGAFQPHAATAAPRQRACV
jgi:hypothetical protein